MSPSPAGDVFRDPASLTSNGIIMLFAAAVVLSLIVVLYHVVTERVRRINRLRFESAALTLAPYLVAPRASLERAIAIARLNSGDRAVALVLRKAHCELRGEMADRLSALLNEKGEVNRLLRDAKARSEWRRLFAVRGLAECGGARVRKTLIAIATSDRSADVREAAREGLLRDGSTEALRAATDSFVAAMPERAGARSTFYTLLAHASEEEFVSLMRSGKLPVMELKPALEAAGDVGRRWAIALAKEHLMSHDAELRATSMRVIGKTGGEGELRLVTHALDDHEWFVRAAAARSLEWMLSMPVLAQAATSRANARERLEQHLTDPEWWVRANCARALARSGREGLEVLTRAAESADSLVRDAAVAALAFAGATAPSSVQKSEPGPADIDPDLTLAERTFRPGGLRA